jgi:hypothetical protein
LLLKWLWLKTDIFLQLKWHFSFVESLLGKTHIRASTKKTKTKVSNSSLSFIHCRRNWLTDVYIIFLRKLNVIFNVLINILPNGIHFLVTLIDCVSTAFVYLTPCFNVGKCFILGLNICFYTHCFRISFNQWNTIILIQLFWSQKHSDKVFTSNFDRNSVGWPKFCLSLFQKWQVSIQSANHKSDKES